MPCRLYSNSRCSIEPGMARRIGLRCRTWKLGSSSAQTTQKPRRVIDCLVDFYEHCTAVVGIDPKASAMLHDVADAAAGAAETMGAAKAKFTEHYELPREFAANGGLMTHDGRWVTGEGA